MDLAVGCILNVIAMDSSVRKLFEGNLNPIKLSLTHQSIENTGTSLYFMEPDVHYTAFLRCSTCHSKGCPLAPGDFRRMVEKADRYRGFCKNGSNARPLSSRRKEGVQTTVEPRISIGHQHSNDLVNSDKESPFKSKAAASSIEEQSFRNCRLHLVSLPRVFRFSSEKHVPYYCLLETENIENGKSVISKFCIGNFEVYFLKNRRLEWCSERKSMYFLMKIRRSPLQVLWKQIFSDSPTAIEEKDITTMFFRLFRKEGTYLDWRSLYNSGSNPIERIPILIVAAAVAGALQHASYPRYKTSCSTCEYTLKYLQNIIWSLD